MSDDLRNLTRELGTHYDQWKESEKRKNHLRDEFFHQINEELKQEVPPQIVVEFPTDDEEAALRQAQRQYIRHRVVSTAPVEGGFQVILEEDAELRPFTYINEADGRVYQRIISEGSPTLDDDSLQEENPALWEAITEEVTERKLRPLEQLTPEQLEQLQPYISMPKPQVRLAAPRKAKDEELDNNDA
jgi:hypothetical protein